MVNIKQFGLKFGSLLALPGFLLVTLCFPPTTSARLAAAVADYDPPIAMPPAKLSETGLYTNIASKSRTVTDGIIAYEVNAALWSDGSRKERWITLPIGTTAVPTDSDQYNFPNKTVLIKNFALDTVIGDVKTSLLVETRFLIVLKTDSTSTFRGISYAWRRDQSDADLVDPSLGKNLVFTVQANGVAVGKRWRYPGRPECTDCHKNRGTLGFITQQLNRPSKANPSINQLQALVTAGVLSKNPLSSNPNSVRWAGLDDASASLELRARSYLAANCSHCHGNKNQVVVGVSHNFDYLNSGMEFMADSGDPFKDGPYVGKPFFDPDFPSLLYPGYPDSSWVLKRMMNRRTFEKQETLQMPPLATYQVDSAALRVLADWVCAMGKKPTGAGCKLPYIPQDHEWAAGIDPRGSMNASARSGFKAYLRAGVLTVKSSFIPAHGANPESAPMAITLSDLHGKSIPLRSLGLGRYAVPVNLPAGTYMVFGLDHAVVVTAGL